MDRTNQYEENVWSHFFGPNLGYVHELYERYEENPEDIDQSVKEIFDKWGKPPLEQPKVQSVSTNRSEPNFEKFTAALNLMNNIRTYGHLAADLNPISGKKSDDTPYLDLSNYNLTKEDLRAIPAKQLWKHTPTNIKTGWDVVEHLHNVYTNTLAFEFTHIHNREEREWLEQMVELGLNVEMDKLKTLERLIEVEGLEQFLHKTFVGQKRFSIEGLDMLVPMLDHFIQIGCENGTENIMIGMAHRGRLNVLAHALGKPYENILSEFHHSPNKELVPSEGSRGINYGWSGDVKYHLGANRDVKQDNERCVRVTLANNPSHLEFVNPVVEGFARAAQETTDQPGYPKQNSDQTFSILIHGDAAFPGEGVVSETLNLSQLKGYKTGGTIHIIANNVIGFTTNYHDARSTRYASDPAKGFEIPIVHVNADDPEACIKAVFLAHEYRSRFKKDVLIDLVGYRRFGHNEMDDPEVTQPIVYQKIAAHPTVMTVFAEKLVEQKVISKEEVEERKNNFFEKLRQEFEKLSAQNSGNQNVEEARSPISERLPKIDTTVPLEHLRTINEQLLQWPEGFQVYPKLEKILKRRKQMLEDGNKVDWALAETLAFATILAEGKPIRLTGQDVERGTFAHRHIVLHDQKTNEAFSPLHYFKNAKASFSVYNSPLSEVSALGFEYGYDVHSPNTLVLWEAQFGDFVNVAQVIIDQFISAGRAKWGQKSSLVMLLPHGYEGQGPEHSSGRLERFLQLSAENNFIVANLTTASQYFHILRRQAAISTKDDARPLIIMTPKSLLRNPRTASPSEAFSEGRFEPVLKKGIDHNDREKVRRLILCSGKVSVDISSAADELNENERSLVQLHRVEQLYPFPKTEIIDCMKQYPALKEVVWVQEEPKNMGAWTFIEPRLRELLNEENVELNYIGRPMRSSPATGEPNIHKKDQARVVKEALTIDVRGDFS
jgi:2-oxoglutarate dehydrogenase E1 component